MSAKVEEINTETEEMEAEMDEAGAETEGRRKEGTTVRKGYDGAIRKVNEGSL